MQTTGAEANLSIPKEADRVRLDITAVGRAYSDGVRVRLFSAIWDSVTLPIAKFLEDLAETAEWWRPSKLIFSQDDNKTYLYASIPRLTAKVTREVLTCDGVVPTLRLLKQGDQPKILLFHQMVGNVIKEKGIVWPEPRKTRDPTERQKAYWSSLNPRLGDVFLSPSTVWNYLKLFPEPSSMLAAQTLDQLIEGEVLTQLKKILTRWPTFFEKLDGAISPEEAVMMIFGECTSEMGRALVERLWLPVRSARDEERRVSHSDLHYVNLIQDSIVNNQTIGTDITHWLTIGGNLESLASTIAERLDADILDETHVGTNALFWTRRRFQCWEGETPVTITVLGDVQANDALHQLVVDLTEGKLPTLTHPESGEQLPVTLPAIAGHHIVLSAYPPYRLRDHPALVLLK